MKTLKKTIYFLSITLLIITSSCSSDDDSPNSNNEIYQSLIGKWFFDDPSTNPIDNNSFTFTSEGNVTYSYWTSSGVEVVNETGTFSVDGEILTMVFPENVELTFIQKVVFINDNKVEFQPTGNSGEDAYEGDYFRADLIIPNELTLRVTGTTFNDQCETTGVELNNSYDIKIAFRSDNNEINSENFNGVDTISINESEELAGDIISLKINLENFDINFPDNGKGTGLKNIIAKVEDSNGNIIVEENVFQLLICTDTTYEIIFSYNKTNNTFSTEYQTHGF
jgi:hypothetical protein